MDYNSNIFCMSRKNERHYSLICFGIECKSLSNYQVLRQVYLMIIILVSPFLRRNHESKRKNKGKYNLIFDYAVQKLNTTT